jgi:hypothetical protein
MTGDHIDVNFFMDVAREICSTQVVTMVLAAAPVAAGACLIGEISPKTAIWGLACLTLGACGRGATDKYLERHRKPLSPS